MEVVVHEYTRDGYRQSNLALNKDGSIPSGSVPTVSAEIVATAIEKLERDMTEAEAGIEHQEVSIAHTLAHLTRTSHSLSSLRTNYRDNT